MPQAFTCRDSPIGLSYLVPENIGKRARCQSSWTSSPPAVCLSPFSHRNSELITRSSPNPNYPTKIRPFVKIVASVPPELPHSPDQDLPDFNCGFQGQHRTNRFCTRLTACPSLSALLLLDVTYGSAITHVLEELDIHKPPRWLVWDLADNLPARVSLAVTAA